MIFFTADLHLGHKVPIELGGRPFSSVEEEAEIFIKNINETCGPKDDLYILGDFAYRISDEEADEYLSKINAKVHMIVGNHDRKTKYNPDLLIERTDYARIKYDHQIFILFHYPIEFWDRQRYGSFMLHGHIHADASYNQRMHDKGLRKYDVGVDANNFRPVSIEYILDYFSDLPVGGANHHDVNYDD